MKASALIVGLTWELDEPVNYLILRRVAEGLEKDIHWFLGKNAPSFFYNVVGSRRNAAEYALRVGS